MCGSARPAGSLAFPFALSFKSLHPLGIGEFLTINSKDFYEHDD
jgi:hypothetical protein